MRGLNDVERVVALCGHIVKSCKGVKYSEAAIDESQKAGHRRGHVRRCDEGPCHGRGGKRQERVRSQCEPGGCRDRARKAHMKRVAARSARPR
ncbi:MAG: hypothetical protein ACLT98_06385 [Eggerthellaceae bacterium]